MAITAQNPAVSKATLTYYDGKLKTWVSTEISGAIAALGNVFTLKGRVNDKASLPAADNKNGDVYTVGAEDATEFEEYYWTGTAWEYMGTTAVSLDGYITETQLFKGAEGTGTVAAPAEGTILAGIVASVKTNTDNIAALAERVTAAENSINDIDADLNTADTGIAARLTALETAVSEEMTTTDIDALFANA